MESSRLLKRVDSKGNFVSAFNLETGVYVRSGVIESGKDTGKDPFMSSFPELIDIGIMGSCGHGGGGLCINSGVQCYQNGLEISKPNMAITDFKRIIDECEGKTYQVALGGRGDPNEHEDFAEMLAYCRSKNVVPNYTTSGYRLTAEQADLSKKYCGAVAVSWYYSEYTTKAINLLLDKGVKTNIHFVLSNASIERAIELLDFDKGILPKGLNAVIFLLHKPIDLGQESNVLHPSNPQVRHFFEKVSNSLGKSPIKIGFDSCCVPGLINYCDNMDIVSVDTCEAARWSMYISSELIATPCSFDFANGFDLHNGSILEAWQSEQFNQFRTFFKTACPECEHQESCLGGCPVARQIILCERKERTV